MIVGIDIGTRSLKALVTDDGLRPRGQGAVIIWMSRRAETEIEGIPAERIQTATGRVLDATHMAAKARWLKRHLPACARIRRFHQPVSHLVAAEVRTIEPNAVEKSACNDAYSTYRKLILSLRPTFGRQ
jgi:sugar (pentulose or hexulose) kinase